MDHSKSNSEIRERSPLTDVIGELSLSRQRLVYERYLPIVRRISMRTARLLPRSVSLDDVTSAGWLGMTDALRRRSPEMDDAHFEAFAAVRVRGAIVDYLRSLDPLPRRLRRASRQVGRVTRQLAAALGRAPMLEEVAAEIGVSLEEMHQITVATNEIEFVTFKGSGADQPAPLEASPEAQVVHAELVEVMSRAIESLPERFRVMLGLYYQEERNFKEIGQVLGVTESRVCQMHGEAMLKMRDLIQRISLRSSRRRPAH